MTQTEILALLGSPLLNVIVIPLLLWLGRSILARAVDNVVEKVIERLETRIGAVETDMKELRHDFSAHDQVELEERRTSRELLSRLVGLLERHYDDFKRLVDETVISRRIKERGE